MNTGGTVGTAAWVFAATRLKISQLAVVGMDYGYYGTTPLQQTQRYYELIKLLGSDQIQEFFPTSVFPLTGEMFYTDVTYYWYLRNFLDLLRQASGIKTFNCTEGGTLVDEAIPCIQLEQFLKDNK